MKIIALSGGVASGKNFIANIFAKNYNCKIFDADERTHIIFEESKEVFDEVEWYFPGSIVGGKINRKKLGTEVFGSQEKLQILEKIIHPRVKATYSEFLKSAEEENVDFVILNIPLLIEKGNYRYDSLIAITTNEKIRQDRYVKRELSKDSAQNEKDLITKFNHIKSSQATDIQRTNIAHFVLDGGLAEGDLVDEVKRIVDNL